MSILIEGNLITLEIVPDVIEEKIKGQSAVDFGFTNSDRLEDEIALAWGVAKAYWDVFQKRLSRLDKNDTATSLTREAWAVPLLQRLGYQPIYLAKARTVNGQTFSISHQTEEGEDKTPLHIVGCRLDLERRPPSGMPRLSPHALMQEYLNCTEHLWGIVTNGGRWRLLRDCSLMSRSAYIEFDLEQVLAGDNYADFRLFYRLFHRSRLPQGVDDVDECLLEFYYQETLQQGGRVRDKLRDGVEAALIFLGNGFLQHPRSQELRGWFFGETGKMPVPQKGRRERDFYRVLLLLVYRLLFLMVAESRNLLLVEADEEKGRIYREYYSVERLRALAEKPTHRREGFQDLWQGARATFALFDENWRGRLLGLSPLNGDLFGSEGLGILNGSAIDNRDLLLALRNLSLYENKGRLQRVNYAALDVEELGSVYESLLELAPQVTRRTGILPVTEIEFGFIEGTERKTTGSYYTPKELVAQLVKTALEPVIEERLRGMESVKEKEAALLSLKVCDPACGSGHFLLAAVRRLGEELARARTGEAQPGAAALRLAKREVLQHCIYGVDLNPLAVDLCKVALWIEGLCLGMPLSFLDHRIRWGNSLVGVLSLDCLDEGIPDDAFKAVTGDDKKVAADFKKRNKKERKDLGSGQILLNLFGDNREEYASQWQELEDIPEATTEDVRRKGARYYWERSSNNQAWWRDFSACNLWTAAFFLPLTRQQLELMPTSEVLGRLLAGEPVTQGVVDAANKLAREKGFFHWPLEFPEVFAGGGFDCILSNPPWERIKLQEKEFFATRDGAIAKAKNKAARTKLIEGLAEKNPLLLREFEGAKHNAEAQSKFVRTSARFPLTAVGDVNTYAVFAETARLSISPVGRAGVIVPTGIATDATTSRFFGDLIEQASLVSLYDFENKKAIFQGVHRMYKFSLLVTSGKRVKQTTFAFFLTRPQQLADEARLFQLSPKEIALINPNTKTCPVFRTRQDAELTKKIYQRVPVLENEETGKNPWGVSFMRMFDMANDSGLFKDKPGEGLVPLYEAKMFHQFDHRWATYTDGGATRDFTDEEKSNPNLQVRPRYWVDKKEVENKLSDRWNKEWLLGWRDVTNATNQRTLISTFFPVAGCNDKFLLMLPSVSNWKLVTCLGANLNSLVLDFVARQKVGGTALKYFTMRQLPIIPPEAYTQEDIDYISSRVLELVYVANDMTPFARDMGYDGEPYIWDEQRRRQLRAELDAKYARLYGLTRDELRYILDPTDIYGADFPSETFRVLKNKEIDKYGEYLTGKLVLAAWDGIDN